MKSSSPQQPSLSRNLQQPQQQQQQQQQPQSPGFGTPQQQPIGALPPAAGQPSMDRSMSGISAPRLGGAQDFPEGFFYIQSKAHPELTLDVHDGSMLVSFQMKSMETYSFLGNDIFKNII
jgi:hypothetical protein